MITKQERPAIIIASEDHDRLLDLAHSMLDRAPGAGDLLEELARAEVVAKLPDDVVGINTVVTFAYDGSTYRGFRLVYPHDADISQKRISVLTPVGAMLLGLSEGQSIHWVSADGRSHRLHVDRVGGRPEKPRARQRVAMEADAAG